jgi:hypothetical protein
MKTIKRSIAVVELLLVVPSALFMTALFVRNLQPTRYEPARTAQAVVDWFAARPVLGLDIFLIALPLVAFLIGCWAVMRLWDDDPELRQAARRVLEAVRRHVAPLLIAASTATAAGILAIVALHLLTD